MTDSGFILIVLGGALIEAAAVVLPPRSALVRRAARVAYLDSSLPHALRYSFVFAPVVLPCILLFGVAAVVPRHVAIWVIAAALSLATASFIATYRPPRRLMPAWFRDDLDAGALPRIRPDPVDWLLFIIVVPFCVAGIASIPVLVYLGAVPN